MAFTGDQRRILRDLVRLWGEPSFVVIGAAALGHEIEMTWRDTRDMDLVLIADLDEYPLRADEELGWSADPDARHRWWKGGQCIDILPYGPALAEAGHVEWPGTGRRINLAALHLAFSDHRRVDVGEGLHVRLGLLEAIVVLKMVAYLDRPAERQRDLEDFGHVLKSYPPDLDPRLGFVESTDPLYVEIRRAEVLGHGIGRILDQGTHERIVRPFVDRARDTGQHAFGAILGSFAEPTLDDEAEVAEIDRLERILALFDEALERAFGETVLPADPAAAGAAAGVDDPAARSRQVGRALWIGRVEIAPGSPDRDDADGGPYGFLARKGGRTFLVSHGSDLSAGDRVSLFLPGGSVHGSLDEDRPGFGSFALELEASRGDEGYRPAALGDELRDEVVWVVTPMARVEGRLGAASARGAVLHLEEIPPGLGGAPVFHRGRVIGVMPLLLATREGPHWVAEVHPLPFELPFEPDR